MADVNINKFRASVVRDGSKPASPGFIVSEGQDPVNPPGTNNYVPYSGATANVELGEFGVEAGFITLDTTPTNTPTDQGTIFWDADDETVDIVLNGYTMKIGEDLFYPVKNQTGSTIAKGVAVRFNGTVGASGRLLIAPFIADGSVASSRFMGVTAEEILNGEDGKVLYFGRVRGINTNAFNEGDILYASTTSAGGYQTAIPVAPNNIVQVAAVVTKSATVGTIFVRPTLGSNINKDEGVKIVSVADKNLLQYQSGTSLWENKSLAQVLGGTSAQFVKGDGSLDSTSYGTGTVTSVGLSSATSGVTIGSTPVTTSGTITLAIATASGSQNGLLSSTDWTTFNNKQNALTNPVTGTGAQGRVAYWNGSGTITSDSLFQWNDFSKRLGIGRTPTVSLDVEGAGFFSGTVTASSIIKSGGTSSQYLMADGSVSTLTNPVTGTGATNYLPKFTGSTTIGNSNVINDASGNLGLGVAPSAWASGTEAALQVGNTSIYKYSTYETGYSVNAYFNAGWKYISNDIASQYKQSSGAHYWYYAPSGTAGNAISFTQAMTLTSGGNLLVGTTTDNGARLQVSGAATFSSSVTANGLNALGSTLNNGNAIRLYRAGLTEMAYIGWTNENTNNSTWYFKSSNGNPIGFSADGTNQQLTIATSGNVGIGTSSPAERLHVETSSEYQITWARTGAGKRWAIGTDTAGFYFNNRTDSILPVYITNGGNVLIGTTTTLSPAGVPSSHSVLTLSGSQWITGFQSNASSNPYGLVIQYNNASPNTTSSQFLYLNDNVGVRAQFYSNGGLGNYQANNVNLSDERTKKDIEPLESYWDKFKAIEIVKFKYKDQTHDDFNIGVIAQQVETIAPEFVDTDGWDTKPKLNEEEPLKSIYTADLYHATIKVLQEAMAKIESMQKEIDTLKN